MEKSNFTVGSLWVRKVDGIAPFYFLVLAIRPLDVKFAGYRFDLDRPIGTYFFNWTEILNSDSNRITWEKLS
mgnify:CR=1 FL=1|jgi:hypothetical protein